MKSRWHWRINLSGIKLLRNEAQRKSCNILELGYVD